MFSDWSRPKLGLATHAGQEKVHRKPPQASRGCVIASYCVDYPCCPYIEKAFVEKHENGKMGKNFGQKTVSLLDAEGQ